MKCADCNVGGLCGYSSASAIPSLRRNREVMGEPMETTPRLRNGLGDITRGEQDDLNGEILRVRQGVAFGDDRKLHQRNSCTRVVVSAELDCRKFNALRHSSCSWASLATSTEARPANLSNWDGGTTAGAAT